MVRRRADARGEPFRQEQDRAIEPGCVARHGNGDHDRTQRPER
jgi:hypothetical protein